MLELAEAALDQLDGNYLVDEEDSVAIEFGTGLYGQEVGPAEGAE